MPDAEGNQPYPAWKRIDGLQGALHPDDEGLAEADGGVITEEELSSWLGIHSWGFIGHACGSACALGS